MGCSVIKCEYDAELGRAFPREYDITCNEHKCQDECCSDTEVCRNGTTTVTTLPGTTFSGRFLSLCPFTGAMWLRQAPRNYITKYTIENIRCLCIFCPDQPRVNNQTILVAFFVFAPFIIVMCWCLLGFPTTTVLVTATQPVTGPTSTTTELLTGSPTPTYTTPGTINLERSCRIRRS